MPITHFTVGVRFVSSRSYRMNVRTDKCLSLSIWERPCFHLCILCHLCLAETAQNRTCSTCKTCQLFLKLDAISQAFYQFFGSPGSAITYRVNSNGPAAFPDPVTPQRALDKSQQQRDVQTDRRWGRRAMRTWTLTSFLSRCDSGGAGGSSGSQTDGVEVISASSARNSPEGQPVAASYRLPLGQLSAQGLNFFLRV